MAERAAEGRGTGEEPPASPAHPEPSTLLERDGELARLGAGLAAARTGGGGLVLIEGAAGLGKSRLLAWAAAEAESDGMLVLRARAGHQETDFSFGVALQLFERWLATAEAAERAEALAGSAALAAPLLEGRLDQDHPGPTTALEPLLHGLFWVVANLAGQRPVLLAVDDLHWADAASLRMLHYVAQRIDELPVALVATRRPREPGGQPLAEQLAAHPLAQRLALDPLSEEAVSRLLAAELGTHADERFARACSRATGGNPFLLHAMAHALRDDGVSPTGANAERIAALRPGTVTQHVLVRIGRLGPDASRLAEAAAILADGARLAQGAAIAELDLAAAAAAADALVAADILASAVPMAFVHPLLRATVHDGMPPAQRGRLHLSAAALLEAEGSPAEAVARQLLPAMRSGEPWAARALRAAAERAMSAGSAESAIQYLSRALVEPLDAAERPAVLLDLARAEALAGSESAREHVEEALALIDDPRSLARAQRIVGEVLLARADRHGAARAFERGLELLSDPDDRLARDLRAGFFTAASLDAELAPQASASVAALLEQPPGGETPAERAALAALAVHRATAGAPRDQPLSLARRAWGDGALLRDEGPGGLGWPMVTGALAWADEFEEALAIAQAVIEQARRGGSLMAYATASYVAQLPVWFIGDIAAARAYGEAALDARRDGWHTYLLASAAVQAQMLVDQDDPVAAEQMLAALDDPREPNAGERPMALASRAALRLVQGRNAEALADSLAAAELCARFGWDNPTTVPWRASAALAAHRLGDPDRALELVEEMMRTAERTGTPTHMARTLRTHAQIAGGDAAVELLREAVAVLDGSQARLEHLRSLAQLGAALRRAGARTEAVATLGTAHEQAHALGARMIERLAREELRVAGARPRRLRFSGADALTASQRRVAMMAADGMSNREIAQALFVTPRTVEQHLYNTYKKLAIGSRAELAAALRGETSAAVTTSGERSDSNREPLHDK